MNKGRLQSSSYRDMSLLQEVTQTPSATQRELSKRIGAALGLTNLMLRRLIKKGYIKISGTKRSRIRYLITPQGIIEKSRLTLEFFQYSLHLYSRVRQVWRQQLAIVERRGASRILLYGTGELAEIAFLTIQEMGLQLVGVATDAPTPTTFLGFPIQELRSVAPEHYDCILVASLPVDAATMARLGELGVPLERLILLPQPVAVATPPQPSPVVEELPPELSVTAEATPHEVSPLP